MTFIRQVVSYGAACKKKLGAYDIINKNHSADSSILLTFKMVVIYSGIHYCNGMPTIIIRHVGLCFKSYLTQLPLTTIH